MATLNDLQLWFEYQHKALVLKIPKMWSFYLLLEPFLIYKPFCNSLQELRLCQKVSTRKSSNFKRKLWLNYMSYNFGMHTSKLVWFSGFQKGAAVISSSNHFWFISIFVTVSKNLGCCRDLQYCGNIYFPTLSQSLGNWIIK